MPHEPKKRHSRRRQGKRRAAIKLELVQTISCPNCGNKHFPHHVCAHCGYYKGQLIIAAKVQNKERKTK